MIYVRITDQGMYSNEWGGNPTYWMEIDQQDNAIRQIEYYPNGNIVSYDSAHPEDQHGGLSINVTQGERDWWGQFMIDQACFEEAWANHTPLNRSRGLK